LQPAYGVFAEPAVLTIGAATYDIAVIDGTRGVAVEEGRPIAVETIRPVVDARRRELAAVWVHLARADDESARISVCDEGVGLPPSVRSRRADVAVVGGV
jgi:hypothetical protein